MTCQKCGRDDGHYMGCAMAGAPAPEPDGSVCADPTCDDPVREWSGRGARPKYCAAHGAGRK